ncbi:MAG TPA: AMP-binding protein [Usitatibacteraceae bacterium]|nr:AMP-binding protein [Usitatibacteraceae bacterium]
MNLAHWLWRTSMSHAQRPAMLLGDAPVMTYRQLADAAAAFAHGVSVRCAIRPGDRIAILAANTPEYLVALYGSWWAGAVVVPVNAKLHPREAAYILADCAAALVVASADWADALQVQAACPAGAQVLAMGGAQWQEILESRPAGLCSRDAGDLAWLFYTSGTTGRPKGAMLSHRNLMAMTFNYFSDVDAIDPDDAIVHAAPFSHGSGLYNIPHVVAGAAHVFPRSKGFDPAEIVALCQTLHGVTLFAAPTMVKRLSEHVAAAGASLPGLKTIVYGGGPMYVSELKRALERIGDKFVQIYGQGESPMTITVLSRNLHRDTGHPRHEQRLASVGVPHHGIEVVIRGEDGAALATGEIGEVTVRGDPVMAGYWKNPAASAAALRDGWLWTGDLGAMDDEGFLTLKDRSKDLIISGGSNIYPREVEEVLLTHPDIAEAAVLGAPHPDWGETVVAFVVLRAGALFDAAALDAHCLGQLARFKRPKHYRVVAELPKNHYGKVVKTVLRDLLNAQPTSPADRSGGRV